VIEVLPDLFLLAGRCGRREAMRGVEGYRTRRFSYADLCRLVAGYVETLGSAGAQRGDRLILWAANRPEWAAAFWSCQFLGIAVVPVDPAFSPDFVTRIQGQTDARLLLHDRPEAPAICPLELPLGEIPFPPHPELPPPAVQPDDIAEIVYTSGTTQAPRGVVLRHRQLCSGLRALLPEFERYRPWARPLQPIRILTLLPLSHLFGQSLGLFVPFLLGGGSVLTASVPRPWDLVELIRKERVSVLVAVPRLLHQLREYLEKAGLAPEVNIKTTGVLGAALRWYRYRRLHRALGWKFWAVVVGGATLSRREEDFWHKVGILLVQGYGLTEASPIVTLNHPLSIGRGSLGKVLRGQEVKLAPDGEILVRGPGVSTEYLGSGREVADGWLKTGDLGEFGPDGRLYFRGRKQEMIVTAQGLNVFAEEVEAVLEAQPQIREACVVGREGDRGEQVHAVLIPADSAADLEAAVRKANAVLEPHQRVQSWSLWPEPDFPRTSSTWKVRRLEVRARIEGRTGKAAELRSEDALQKLVAQVTGRLEPGAESQNLEEFGISSLDRIELLSRLEEDLQRPLDEAEFSSLRTVGEIRRWLERQRTLPDTPSPGPPMPRWPHRLPFRIIRYAFQYLYVGLIRCYLVPEVTGLEHLGKPDFPVIFAANHTSHLDTPVFLASLPAGWRRRVAPAVRLEFFAGRFFPERAPWLTRIQDRLLYFLACLLFQVFPLPQSSPGVGAVLRFCGELVARSHSILIFPEGERRVEGGLGAFRPGAALLARLLGIPLIPVFLQGIGEVLPPGCHWPRYAKVRVAVGPPFRVSPHLPATAAVQEFERFYRQWQNTLG
jgi:long-chain acyl-CoA synthetase